MIVPGIGGLIVGQVSAPGSGTNGGQYDPSNLATMFQDAAGTIPVTASGQPVGRINDISGHGNHLTQSASSKRPTFMDVGGTRWLDFDGVDDDLVSSGPGLTMTQPDDIAIAVWFDTLTGIQHVYDNFDEPGRHVMFSNGGANLMIHANNSPVATTVAIGQPYILTARFDGAASSVRKDGVAGATVDAGTSPLSSFTLGALQDVGNFLDGRVYGLWMRDPFFSPDELAVVEAWLDARTP